MNISIPFQPFDCHLQGFYCAAELAGITKPNLKTRKGCFGGFVIEIDSPPEDEGFWRGFVAGKNWTIGNRQSFGLIDSDNS